MTKIQTVDFDKLSPGAKAEVAELLRQQELASAAGSGTVDKRPIGRMLPNPNVTTRTLPNGHKITEPVPRRHANSHFVLIPKLVDRIK